MTYQEFLNHIYGLGRFGIKPGLERITSLLHALHDPQAAFKSIHVAGTNGKGSTSSFLASIVKKGGYRVGLFTSPHLVSFTERIRVDGCEITEEQVLERGQRVLSAAPPGTTFFEIVTALACLHFAEQQVDLAVMEVGMGGRLDATNALQGTLSVITPIGLDHCEFLGSSLAAIAREKAGVAKGFHPVVASLQQPEALAEIQMHCRKLQSPLYRFGCEFTAEWEENGFSYRGIGVSLRHVKPGIPGNYQLTNAAAALASAEILGQQGFHFDTDALRAGIEEARWPGRMEMISVSPRILLDGAHNPAGSAALCQALSDIPRNRLLLVAGVMGDKDLDGILGPLLKLADQVYLVTSAVARALPSAELATFCRARGVEVTNAGTVAAGLAAACNGAGAEDLVLVSGSLFIVGEARAILLSQEFEPFRG